MSREVLFMMLAGLATTPLFAVKPIAADAAGPDDFLTKLEAAALVHTLNGEILASRSTTLTLENWCNEHALAGISEAKIVAHLSGIEPKPPTAEQRHRLGIGPEVEVKYRHVQLMCGDQILSEADKLVRGESVDSRNEPSARHHRHAFRESRDGFEALSPNLRCQRAVAAVTEGLGD
jgi:hypothetical protein